MRAGDRQLRILLQVGVREECGEEAGERKPLFLISYFRFLIGELFREMQL